MHATSAWALAALLAVSGTSSVAFAAKAKVQAGAKAKAKKGKKGKKAKKPEAEAEADADADAEGEGDAEGDDDELRWIDRHAPENHMVDAGLYLGAMIIAENHGLFDPGLGPQPRLNRSAFDIGFRLAYMPLRFVGVGMEIGGMPTRAPGAFDRRADLYTVRAHVIGQLDYRVTPTLVLGGGLLGIRSDEPILNSGDPAFHWGPGVKIHANDWVAVRLDGRHIVTGGGADGNRVHHGEILVGVDVTLRVGRWVNAGRSKRNKDRDNDLVPDRVDECPDEYGEDDVGCPKNRDSDKDGVPDARDRCPKEWGDGPGGCPVRDKDGDGILDSKDSCEDQPENYNGFEDLDGCPDEPPEEVKRLTGVLEGIYFASGKSTILKKSARTLDSVVETLKKYPDVRVKITGHTDSTGSRDNNVELSRARAEAVRDYLVGKGIDTGRIQTEGVGPDEPVGDNKTKGGRARNRRIEFEVLGVPSTPTSTGAAGEDDDSSE
jgi:OOP family OmpA-OmpF porin